MTFLAPAWLLVLVPVAALVGVYAFLQLRQSSYAVRFSNLSLLSSVAPRHPGWRRHLTAGLLLLSMSSSGVALARPAAMVRVPRQIATIIVCIDVSLSMQATDVQPTRLKAAQQAATGFVNQLPPRFNVALVSFAGSANLVVPPTTNHQLVVQGIQQLQLAESTAIGEAIFTSLDAIKLVKGVNGKAPPAAVVLLSDGATNTGRPNDDAAAAAKNAGVPVNTIAFGTDNGTVTINGTTQPVPVDRNALHLVARQTGGQSYDAASEQELRAIYQNLGSQIGWGFEPREISMVFVGLALVFAFLSAAGALYWQNRIL